MSPEANPAAGFSREGMEAALDRAYLRALEIGRRTGTPVWIMVDGKLVDALAEERAAANGTPANANGSAHSKPVD